MLTNLIAGSIAGLLLVQPADTTISAQGLSKLRIENHEGTVIVRTWSRNEIQIESDDPEYAPLRAERSGASLKIRPGTPPGETDIDMQVTMPARLDLEIHAPFSDIEVDGSEAAVAVQSVEGDVWVRGGGPVAIRSVEGDVTVERVRGGVSVSTADGDVTLADVSGPIAVEGIDGDIGILGADTRDVQVTTVDGDVIYEGTIHDSGRYRLATHDGEVVCTISEGANVTVSVATFDGDFRSSFPIALQGSVDKRFEFTLGSGSARLELEAFDGEIYLVRPGETIPDDWQ